MNERPATLWGIDGTLAGEEASVQARLPFIHVGNRIFAARSVDWSWDSDSLHPLSEDEALDRGTATPFASQVSVVPGHVVVVSGPIFDRRCAELGLDFPSPEVKSVEGFALRMMPVDAFLGVAAQLNQRARRIFDNELRSNRDVTDRARIALDILQNTGVPDTRSIYIRTIAAAHLDCDPDAVRRIGKLAQIRLHTNAERLRADVDEYLSVVLADPRLTASSQNAAAALTRDDVRQVIRAEFSTFLKRDSIPTEQQLFDGPLFADISNAFYKSPHPRYSLQSRRKDSEPLVAEVGHA